mgnify:CR=1 FL=1
MTTWTTFETIDERGYDNEVYIDRLGMHSYRKDERTRFKLERINDAWIAYDYETEDEENGATVGSMREVIQWVAGRVLYGA